MKGVRLDHATIDTDDVPASVAFYAHFLGLKPGWRPDWDVGGAWLYAHDGDYPILHLLERPRSEGKSMFNHVAFRGEDLKSYLAKLRSTSCWFEARPVDQTPYTQVHHFDPNDVRIEVLFEEPLGAACVTSDDFHVGATDKSLHDSAPGMDSIQHLQAQIDDIDARLVALLRERFQRTRAVGAIRRRENLPLLSPERAESQKRQFVTSCNAADLNEGMAVRLIDVLQEQVLAERAQL